MGKKLIKVCGMTDAANVRAVEKLGVDMLGFIFYPKSPRCVREVPEYLPTEAGRVGVFVNESLTTILEKNEVFHFDYVQLHGSESPELCEKLRQSGLKVVKAFSVADASDLARTALYEPFCDLFLFDTKTASVGGSGNTFDWSVLTQYKGEIPFLLSGGLSLDNIEDVLAFSHEKLAGYDLNSRFETRPGLKDIDRLNIFVQRIHEQN